MNGNEWSHLWHHKALNVSCLQAHYTVSAYPRHSHDYYVVAVVDSGLQSFSHNDSKYYTPPDGLILLNPGEVHTGEAADEHGFVYRALYPTVEHMQHAAAELGGTQPPFFSFPRADDLQLAHRIRALFATLRDDYQPLESETRYLLMLIDLTRRFGDVKPKLRKAALEPDAVQKVRAYIDANYAQPITLSELADHVSFSRYYLLRMFRKATGISPHLYLESVRVRNAQRLLVEGNSIVDVAYQVGFGSQSHFTQRFKQIIGVTPGVYARQVAE